METKIDLAKLIGVTDVDSIECKVKDYKFGHDTSLGEDYDTFNGRFNKIVIKEVVITKKKVNKRYFRPNYVIYDDAMRQKKELNSVESIACYLNDIMKAMFGLGRVYFTNVRIDKDTKRKHRDIADDWGKFTYCVLADFGNNKGQCVGFCNFYDR